MSASTTRTAATTKVLLVGEVVGTYVQARRWTRRTNLPDALRALRALSPRASRPGSSLERGQWYAGVVRRTLRFLPLDDRCLILALVTTGVLARRGIDTLFVLGVRPGERFAAHAWVELDGHALLPPLESEFARLTEL